MTVVITVAFVISLVASSIVFVLVSIGWSRALSRVYTPAPPEDITVIIAAHNEVASVPDLIAALAEQDYPDAHIRILLVDDRSDDGTAETAKRCSGTLPIEIVRIDTVPEGMSPKKHALHEAIMQTETDILLFTDADCRPGNGWISGMHRVFASGAEVVIAPAPIEAGSTFVSRYAAYESCRTAAFMVASATLDKPYMASGRSWGYRKSLYQRCDGLPALGRWLGGDDDLLLQQFEMQGAKISCCVEASALVRSDSPSHLPGLVRQKLRHYSVSRAYSGRGAFFLAIGTMFQLLALPLAALLCFLLLAEGRFAESILPLVGMLWMMYYNAGFMLPIAEYLCGSTHRKNLVGMECFHLVFSALVGLVSFVKPQRW